MGYVYLIGEENREGIYKIGSTRAKDVNKRLKQLQTGNSSELYLKDFYATEKPFKLEKMLHNKFKDENVINEWFELDEDTVKKFKEICNNFQVIIDSLKDNPFW